MRGAAGGGVSDIMFGVGIDDKTKAAISSIRKNVSGFHNELKSTAGTLAGLFSVNVAKDMSDSITDLRNRLNSFNESAAQTENEMDMLMRVSMLTRQSFDSTGVVFTRMKQATAGLGYESEQLAKATATVAATFKLSGTSAYEANNSARQLAQGLSSGRISGDEMRSVLENNVVLAQLLTKGFGQDMVGALREMGAAGKVTTDKVMPILIEAFEETTTKVQEMQPTIGQSLTNLQTLGMELVRRFNEVTGAADTVANFIMFLSQNLGKVAAFTSSFLIPAFIKFSMVLSVMAVGAVKKLGMAMLSMFMKNPVTAGLMLILTVMQSFLMGSEKFRKFLNNTLIRFFQVTLPNVIDGAVGMFTILQTAVMGALNFLAQKIKPVIEVILAPINALKRFLGEDEIKVDFMKVDVSQMNQKLDKIEERIKGRTKAFNDKVKNGEIPNIIDGLLGFGQDGEITDGEEKAVKIDTFAQKVGKKLKDLIAKQKDFAEEIADIIKGTFDNLAKNITDFVTGGKLALKDLINVLTKDLLNAMIRTGITDPMGEAFSHFLKKQGGGQVLAGTPYIVGEKGAELFIPSSSGNIVPNHQLSGGGGIVINQSVNFATGVQDTVKNEVLQLLPDIAETSKAAVVEAMNRGGNFRRGMR